MAYNIRIYDNNGELLKDVGDTETLRQAKKVTAGIKINLHPDNFVTIKQQEKSNANNT